EYVAQALRMSTFRPPPVTEEEAAALNAVVFAGPPPEQSTLPRLDHFYLPLRDGAGRTSWPHFWLYSLLAVPFVWATAALGLSPLWAFTALNVVLLGGAFWIVSGGMRWPALALLFASPIVWWVDKAHTEVMTFAMLSSALALAGTRPWWSCVALGSAAAQNS